MVVAPAKSLGIFFLLTISHTLISQDIDFITFGQNQGLGHSQLLDISQDHNGDLWLGSATRSVYRFDGRNFFEYKIYLPQDARTLSAVRVSTDTKNRVWVLTNLGLVKFDGVTSVLVEGSTKIPLGTTSTLTIGEDDTPWIIDESGKIYFVKSDTIRTWTRGNQHLNNNAIGCWYASNSKVVFYNENGTIVSDDGLGNVITQQPPWGDIGKINFIKYADHQYLIASTQGVFTFSEQHGLSRQHDEIKHVSQLARDKQGVIWGVSETNLFKIEKNNRLTWVERLGKQATNDILRMYIDRDGEMWVSVDLGGLMKYKPRAWIQVDGTSHKHITAIAEDTRNGTLVWGTYNDGILGLGAPHLLGTPITSVSISKEGRLLAGTLQKGMYEVTANQLRHWQMEHENKPLTVFGITQQEGKVYAGVSGGVRMLDTNGALEKYEGPTSALEAANLITVRDRLYFTGMAGGLWTLKGDKIEEVDAERFNKNIIYVVKKAAPRSGYLLAGEFPYIILYDDKFKFNRQLSTKAFASNILLAEFLNESTLILGSNDGLFKATIEDDSLRLQRKYGPIDGYGGEEMYVGASLTTTDNRVFIGTVAGAYSYNPNNEGDDLAQLTTYITAVDFSTDTPSAREEGFRKLPTKVQLPFNQNTISFSFAGTCLANPYDIRFRHRLNGLQQNWSQVNSSQQITYSNLKPGKYVFEVEAMRGEHRSGTAATFSFMVTPAFWQTAPFFIGVATILILATVMVIWSIAAYRVKNLRMREEIRQAESASVRKQMSMDFHDEMGNKLAGMLAQASILKVSNADRKFLKHIEYFEKNAYDIYHGTKDFIWSIDIASNKAKEIIGYIRDFGFNFFERNSVRFHFRMDPAILDKPLEIQLPDGFNRQIILIFKEAMTNALKHSGCTTTLFEARLQLPSLCLLFSDNGKWTENRSRGSGLKIMQKRAEKIGATLDISHNTNGTTVVLNLKMAD